MKRRLGLLAAAVLTASALPVSVAPITAQALAATTAAWPSLTNVYVIVMENKGYRSVVGDAHAPYISGLIRDGALASRYFAIRHPSQPNYLAIFSGSTQGVTDDARHRLYAASLPDQLEAAGRSWRAYAENVPPDCYRPMTASGGPDGPGTYARRHEPAVSFASISGNPSRCANITDFSHFSPGAADFSLIVPNLCHDMHDCSVARGDAFLSRFLPAILESPSFATSALFLTWDEGDTNRGAGGGPGGGRIPLVAIGPSVRHGYTSTSAYTHYSLLRSIEDAWALPCLANACHSTAMRDLFLP